MRILKGIEKLVVDANPILSSIISGKSREIFLSGKITEFYTTAFTIEEVRKYIPIFAKKPKIMRAKITEGDLYTALSLLHLQIFDRDYYIDEIEHAKAIIAHRDPKDVDLLALAIKLRVPIWSNDEDFNLADIPRFTTAKLLKLLRIGERGDVAS